MEKRNFDNAEFLYSQVKKDLEKEFQRKMRMREITAKNINKIIDKDITFGDRIADEVAKYGGSWRFIIGFGIFLVLWMILNSFILMKTSFDPYPYILLNLCLSCLAALQAPVIMMSQNRQAKKDRLEAEEDFKTNVRSEIQIKEIIAKLDLFIDLFIKMNSSTDAEHLKEISKSLEEIKDKLESKK